MKTYPGIKSWSVLISELKPHNLASDLKNNAFLIRKWISEVGFSDE